MGFLLLLVSSLVTVASGGNVGITLTELEINRSPGAPSYTAFDDASWAVTSSNLSSLLGAEKQSIYDEFINGCIEGDPGCRYEEKDRLYMNSMQPSCMVNYTERGFAKIRAPEPLFKLLKEFWDANHENARVEYNDETAYHNTWRVPTTILMTEEEQFVGGGWNLSAAVWNAARDILEEWSGQKLAGSSVYGIRVYHNQSVLTPHVDRLPLVSSAIINVAQDVEEDWVLEVYGHDGKATNVTMLPGDMVLYESHSVIHGRPFPLNGNFYANIFVHFEPMGDVSSMESLPEEGSLPPYVVPGSSWEEDYFHDFPSGWTLLTNVNELARRGDLYTLRYVAQRDASAITSPSKRCGILELATRNRHIDILEFLIKEMEFDVNMVCTSRTVLDHVYNELSHDDAVIPFLRENGAITYEELIAKNPELIATSDYRCRMLEAAIRFEKGEVMEFLFESMGYDINMICDNHMTPMDRLLEGYDNDDDEEPSEETDEIYAYLIQNEGVERRELEELPEPCTITDERCAVMEEAIVFESHDVLDFLFAVMNFDVNMVCDSYTPLEIALEYFGVGMSHPMVAHLVRYGARSPERPATNGRSPWEQPEEHLSSPWKGERCATIGAAIRSDNRAVLEFLLQDMSYDINMFCGAQTPLDFALYAKAEAEESQEQEEPRSATAEFLIAHGARTSRQILEENQEEEEPGAEEGHDEL